MLCLEIFGMLLPLSKLPLDDFPERDDNAAVSGVTDLDDFFDLELPRLRVSDFLEDLEDFVVRVSHVASPRVDNE